MTPPPWSHPNRRQRAVADRIVTAIVQSLTTEQGVHAETAIASAARMAGTFLLRSLPIDIAGLTPGTACFSEAANEAGPVLLQTFWTALSKLQIEARDLDITGNVSRQNLSQMALLATQRMFEPPLRDVARSRGLDAVESAHACALAAAQLVKLSARVLAPDIGCNVAVQGFVEGSKTVPAPLADDKPLRRSRLAWLRRLLLMLVPLFGSSRR